MKPLSKSSEKNRFVREYLRDIKCWVEAEKETMIKIIIEEVKIRYRIINLNNRFIISTSVDGV